MLSSFLNRVDKKTVIIIDEYDAPIIHTYKDMEKAEKIRETLSTFYTVIKNTSEKIRFFLSYRHHQILEYVHLQPDE